MKSPRTVIVSAALAAIVSLVPLITGTSALASTEAQTSATHDTAWWTTFITNTSANGFRGPILVPANQSAPFDQPVVSTKMDYGSSALASPQDEYQINLANAETMLTDISLSGARGRSVFDGSAEQCTPGSGYCAANLYDRPDTSLNDEWFPDLTVHGQPAIATHNLCCNGGFWSIAWYEPSADTSYMILILGDVDVWQHYDIDPANEPYAEMLAARAEALVPAQREPVVNVSYKGVRANLLGVERPAKLAPSTRAPKPGLEYLTVELRLDNLTAVPVDFSYVRFKVEMADSTRWETAPNWREPPLDTGQILPMSSVRGWVTFAVPIGVPVKQLLWTPTYDQTVTMPLS